MRQIMKFNGFSAAVLLLAASLTQASDPNAPIDIRPTGRAAQPFEIKAKPFGPTEKDVELAKSRIGRDRALRAAVAGAKHRLVGFEFLNAEADPGGTPPTMFRVTYYDYTSDVAVIAEGDFAGRLPIKVREERFDPVASPEEFEAAKQLIAAEGKLAAGANIEYYEPMPPVSNMNGERLVNIGIRNLDTGDNQIVGISFKNDSIVRYENNAPPTARAEAGAGCGVANSGQGSTGVGVAGTLALTALEPGNPSPVWEMVVVRPSSSSGAAFEGSGVEVRDVKYRGKSVLKRGHLPVLNVQYISGCGPFRDWQYSEGFFQIPTTGVTFPAGPNGGFAQIASPGIATTIVETGNDTGNFQGVAIYQQNVGGVNEMVLVSELNAGWYRYIMEWRFGFDGRIKPRYGFGSIANSCVCIQRNHHAYWRFDFDIVQPSNKVFMMERGRKFQVPVETEAAFFRNYARNRSFLIQNASGDEAYTITPNLTDSSVTDALGNLTDTFGKGDFWLLRFQGSAASPGEIDDPNTNQSINIAPWLTNESLVNQDIVIWYGAHQTRKDESGLAAPNVLTGQHVIGPELRPVRW
jgi:hypothetical protein